MCIQIYICIYVYIYIHVCIYAHIHIYVNMYIHMYIYTYINIHKYVYTNTYTMMVVQSARIAICRGNSTFPSLGGSQNNPSIPHTIISPISLQRIIFYTGKTQPHHPVACSYEVASISRLLQIIGLFCRISSRVYGSFKRNHTTQ